MTTTSNKLSLLIDQQYPDYVDEYYPMFVVFVTKYFEWLDQQGNPQNIIQTIKLNRDIDTVASSLATRFLTQYVPDLPQTYAADRNVLVKYFRDFYERKGSEDSFKFFFKAFFNDDISISRPREVLFNTSGSNWVAEQTLKITSVTGDPEDLEHTTVTGTSSNATAVVNQVIRNNNSTYTLYLSRDTVVGAFTSSESISGYSWDFVNDVSSQVVVQNTAPVITQSGRFLDSRSQLSSDQILQDSYYYQTFSYVIRSHTNRELWYNSVIRQLHPAGHNFFNQHVVDTSIVRANGFVSSNTQETTVKLFNENSFILAPGYSWDRTADFQTGTSATTTAGAISYTAGYRYPGENVTFAQQKGGDSVTFGTARTEFVGNGATFDKIGAGVGLDEQLVVDGWGVNSSVVNVLFNNTSSITLSSNARITSGSIYGASSFLLVVTWMKDPTLSASSEATNALSISLSSTAAMAITYDAETQRNYRKLAVGQTLQYPKLTYYNSSNTLTCTTGYSGGETTTATIKFTFIPYNPNRNQSYSRAVFRITNIGLGGIIDYGVAVSSSSTFNALGPDHLNISLVGI